MQRLFGRRFAFDLAVTLLVVFAAVSVADIDDYEAHSQAALTAFEFSSAPGATPEKFLGAADPESDRDHHCACLLCVMTIPDSSGPRLTSPSPGKMSRAPAAVFAGASHPSEIFHPPPA